MNLNSIRIFPFIVILYGILWVLQKLRYKFGKSVFRRGQIYILLLFSYLFLIFCDWHFCIFVLCVTGVAYSCALLMEKVSTDATKRIFCVGGGGSILIMLAIFKYATFFMESIGHIFHTGIPTIKPILPLGISFYTFSALSYLLDIYMGKYKAEKNLCDVALYISIFPKLIAGPIIRARELMPQIKSYGGISHGGLSIGIQIFMFGLFKKMVLADHLGIFVDDVFYAPAAYDTVTVALAGISYSLQIYFDFSGYSDMATGIARMLGFRFRKNFDLPYIACGFSEFWGRWHISLSSWFRDYVYIPLGGSRSGRFRTYVNLFLTMMLSGLWHGAGWTFVVWGALHGLASCLEKMLSHIFRSCKKMNGALRILYRIFIFVWVTVFWVIFRADSFGDARNILINMFTWHTGICQPYTWSVFAIICLLAATCVAYYRSKVRKLDRVNGFYPILNLGRFWPRVIFFVFCGITVIMGYYGNTVFIYSNF